MLTDKEITIIEAIYLAIDSGQLSDYICNKFINAIKNKSDDEYVYLMWLLIRWKNDLRIHKYHLPTRINKLY
jgi:hypothetical protein